MKSFTFKQLALAVTVLSSALVAGQANAALVTFNYQNATDGSGKTSTRIPASNASLPLGYFVETFDRATAPSLIPGAGLTQDYVNNGTYIDFVSGSSAGCGFNTFGAAAVTTTGGGMGIQNGSTGGVAAAPAGDTTCFGFGPRPGGGTPATVRVDYAPLINFLIGANLVPIGTKISYLGLYYGSIDSYNNIAFYNGSSLLNTGSGLLSDGVITGDEVLAANGGTSGNQAQPGSNVYVNIDFDANETFTAFEFRTSGVAFELDNVVIGLTTRTEIPEPASLALLGVGLLGLGAARRRKVLSK